MWPRASQDSSKRGRHCLGPALAGEIGRGRVSVERARVARGDERSPVERMGVLGIGQELELGGAQGFVAAGAGEEMAVIGHHEVFADRVGYLPQAHDHGLGPGDAQGPAQAVHAVADRRFAQAGVAGRQHDQSGAFEAKRGRLERGQNAVVFGLRRLHVIGPGQGQTRLQERVIGHRLRLGAGDRHGAMVHRCDRPALQEESMGGDVQELWAAQGLDSRFAGPRAGEHDRTAIGQHPGDGSGFEAGAGQTSECRLSRRGRGRGLGGRAVTGEAVERRVRDDDRFAQTMPLGRADQIARAVDVYQRQRLHQVAAALVDQCLQRNSSQKSVSCDIEGMGRGRDTGRQAPHRTHDLLVQRARQHANIAAVG